MGATHAVSITRYRPRRRQDDVNTTGRNFGPAGLAADLFAERDQFLRFKDQVDDELGVPIPDGKLASNNTYEAALDWLGHLNKRGALASVKPHFAREVRSHSRRLLAKEERVRKRWEDLDRDVEYVAVPALAAEAPPLTDSASKEPEQ